MSQPKVLICPYCGETQPTGERCRACSGLFESLSRQATHNAMGPWFVRNPKGPFQPGCSYETLVNLIERGQVEKLTIVRSPTTGQFWTVAKRVPGIAHLFGYCHHCGGKVDPAEHGCDRCGAPFGAYLDRNYLGLPEVRPLPWEAPGGEVQAARMPVPPADYGPRRLSSFATDAELGRAPEYGGGTFAVAAAVTDPVEVPATMDNPPTELTDAEAREELLSGTATRSMQRRLAEQRRRIRLYGILMGMMAVTLAVMAVPNVMMLIDALRGGGDPVRTDDAAAVMPPADARPLPEAPAEPAKAATAPAGEPAAAPTTVPTEVESGPTEDEQAWQQALVDAAAAADRGADDSLELAERIQAYEDALAKLDEIANNAPPELVPPDLGELRDRTSRALERLRLVEFFP